MELINKNKKIFLQIYFQAIFLLNVFFDYSLNHLLNNLLIIKVFSCYIRNIINLLILAKIENKIDVLNEVRSLLNIYKNRQ